MDGAYNLKHTMRVLERRDANLGDGNVGGVIADMRRYRTASRARSSLSTRRTRLVCRRLRLGEALEEVGNDEGGSSEAAIKQMSLARLIKC